VLVCGVVEGGILWFVVGELEGKNNMEPLSIDGRIILSRSAKKQP